jgi:predicted ATPase
MISRVWAENFKSLRNVSVDLEPITVLVGPNGSGKSNLVAVLRFLRNACRLGLELAVGLNGIVALRRWTPSGEPPDVTVGVEVDAGEWVGSFELSLGSVNGGDYRVRREACQVRPTGSTESAGYATADGTWERTPSAAWRPRLDERALVLPLLADTAPFSLIHDYLVRLSFYDIEARLIVGPQKPQSPFPLAEDGLNLASTLLEMERLDAPLLGVLKEALRSLAPDVLDVDVTEVAGYLVTRLRHKMGGGHSALFDLSHEADGTLRLLGILTALYQQLPRTLIAIEEPELRVHPGALYGLWEEVERAVAMRGTQVLLTSHSPDLLDLCSGEQLRLVEKRDGVTLIGPIEDRQKEAIQRRLFAPGELLRAEGLRPAQGALEL